MESNAKAPELIPNPTVFNITEELGELIYLNAQVGVSIRLYVKHLGDDPHAAKNILILSEWLHHLAELGQDAQRGDKAGLVWQCDFLLKMLEPVQKESD